MNTPFSFEDTSIVVGLECISVLNNLIVKQKPSNIFIIVDRNTKQYCLPTLLCNHPVLSDSKIIEAQTGEDAKSLKSFEDICLQLIHHNIDRNSLIINLGGGVICDMGGFVSSVLKRGIQFINIPTTLMSQIDAAIGGKVGLNIAGYKNQIGVFNNPACVLIYPPYLSSLSTNELLSAQAEVFKYAIIYDESFWNQLRVLGLLKKSNLKTIILKCVSIKSTLVSADYYDWDERRKLNFGHSIAHAIESVFLKNKNPISHGFALSVGIICETYISYIKYSFSKNKFNNIVDTILEFFPIIHIDSTQDDLIINYIKSDKKNSYGLVNFTLIKDVGCALVNCPVSREEILSSLDFYREKCHI